MLNFILILIPYLLYEIHFWFFLFLSISICRYNLNKNIVLLIVSLLGTIAIFTIPFLYRGFPFKYIVLFQFFVGLWSITLNIKNKLWKKDIVFIFMETSLVLFFFSYIPLKGFDIFVIIYLLNWLKIYIFFQAILILVKTVIGIKISNSVSGFGNRLRLLIYTLPKIDTSFGFNDFAFMGSNRYIHPNTPALAVKDIKMTADKIKALVNTDLKEFIKVKEEHDEFREDMKQQIKYNRIFN